MPEVHLTHDSAAAIGLILEHLAETGERISELVAQLPRLTTQKHNVVVEPHRLYSVLQEFRATVEQEGLKSTRWMESKQRCRAAGSMRASNTNP